MGFKIEETKDFIRLLIFLIISPVIGMVMLLGFMATSLAMVCMFIKDFIMNKTNFMFAVRIKQDNFIERPMYNITLS